MIEKLIVKQVNDNISKKDKEDIAYLLLEYYKNCRNICQMNKLNERAKTFLEDHYAITMMKR